MSRNLRTVVVFAALVTLLLTLVFVGQGMAKDKFRTPEQLGEFLYFDEDLSEPAGQACASCHLPEVGFDDPDAELPVSEGVIADRFGDRNSPASAYAMYAPLFHWDGTEGLFIGGQFWDGRATGEVLGDPLADQALGPFLNPVEMANPDKATVVKDVTRSSYSNLFKEVCGKVKFYDTASVEAAYDCIAGSIAAFERTELFGQFTSKYDAYLQDCLAAGGDPDGCATGTNDEAKALGPEFFTEPEWDGLQLFMGEENDNDGVLEEGEGASCVLCHVASWTDPADYGDLNVHVPDWSGGMIPPVFTDFTFDNLGVPKNWNNPFLYQDEAFNPAGQEFIDLGLARFLEGRTDLWPGGDWALADEDGKFKVMTLRNSGLTAPYAHNGFFSTLEAITHFYNTRDVASASWEGAEVPYTVNTEELGNLGLSATDEAALVQFMMTLNDGSAP